MDGAGQQCIVDSTMLSVDRVHQWALSCELNTLNRGIYWSLMRLTYVWLLLWTRTFHNGSIEAIGDCTSNLFIVGVKAAQH